MIITRNNQPILKLIQILPITKRRQRGSIKGQIWLAPDFNDPLEDTPLEGQGDYIFAEIEHHRDAQ